VSEFIRRDTAPAPHGRLLVAETSSGGVTFSVRRYADGVWGIDNPVTAELSAHDVRELAAWLHSVAEE
jgi:hypothetical protein